jgi:hypothetical protein
LLEDLWVNDFICQHLKLSVEGRGLILDINEIEVNLALVGVDDKLVLSQEVIDNRITVACLSGGVGALRDVNAHGFTNLSFIVAHDGVVVLLVNTIGLILKQPFLDINFQVTHCLVVKPLALLQRILVISNLPILIFVVLFSRHFHVHVDFLW